MANVNKTTKEKRRSTMNKLNYNCLSEKLIIDDKNLETEDNSIYDIKLETIENINDALIKLIILL